MKQRFVEKDRRLSMASIWKLQRPILEKYIPVLEIMAYTEGRKDTAFIPMTDKEVAELFGDEFKLYVKAKVNKKTGILEVKKIVGWQDW